MSERDRITQIVEQVVRKAEARPPSDVYRWGIEMLVLPVDRTGEVWVPLIQRRRGRYKFLSKDEAQGFIADIKRYQPYASFRPVQLPTAISAPRRAVAAARRGWR